MTIPKDTPKKKSSKATPTKEKGAASHHYAPIEYSTQYGFTTLFTVLLLTLFGYAITNIFHFSIEDYFHEPILGSASSLISRPLIGITYAVNIAWILVLFPCIVVLRYIQNRLIEKNPDLLESNAHKSWYMGALFTFGGAAIFYMVRVVYSFFIGLSNGASLLNVVITILMLLLGILYAYLEINRKVVPQKRTTGVIYSVMGVLVLLSLSLTLTLESPAKMRRCRVAINHYKNVTEVKEALNHYVRRVQALPASLDDLVAHGFLEKRILNETKFTFKNVKSNLYKLCLHYDCGAKEARRLLRAMHYYHDEVTFTRGENCMPLYLDRPSPKSHPEVVYKPFVSAAQNNQTIQHITVNAQNVRWKE